jgi:hypothetical protein
MLTIWFMASSMKSMRMCVWIGRNPASAMPIATPVIPSSDNGVSMIRS